MIMYLVKVYDDCVLCHNKKTVFELYAKTLWQWAESLDPLYDGPWQDYALEDEPTDTLDEWIAYLVENELNYIEEIFYWEKLIPIDKPEEM